MKVRSATLWNTFVVEHQAFWKVLVAVNGDTVAVQDATTAPLNDDIFGTGWA